MVIRSATGLIGWVLRRTRFHGVTLPWGIYILPEKMGDMVLVRHEEAHAEQIARYGVVGFYTRYVWYTIRHGYWNNPLEVEARDKSMG